jgi:hypothetical protein
MAAAGVSQTAVVTANGESTSAPRTRLDIIAIADIYQMSFFITSPRARDHAILLPSRVSPLLPAPAAGTLSRAGEIAVK